MRSLPLAALICLFIPIASVAENFKPADTGLELGDSLEEVKDTLGTPRGMLTRGDIEIYIFDLGEVRFINGEATHIDLISSAEYKAQEAVRMAKRERAREIAAEREAEQIARGEELKLDKQTDPAFLAADPEYRLRFWRHFATLYPDVDVTEELTDAAAQYEVWLAEQERERRLAELEYRVQRAERAAEDARDRAQEAERQDRRWRSYGPYYPYHRRSSGPRIKIGTDGGTVITGGYGTPRRPVVIIDNDGNSRYCPPTTHTTPGRITIPSRPTIPARPTFPRRPIISNGTTSPHAIPHSRGAQLTR